MPAPIVPECVVGSCYTVHKFVAPFKRCQCGQERWTDPPPRTGLGEKFSMTEKQHEHLTRLTLERDLSDIFRG